MKLSFIIPCYCSEQTIRPVVDGIRQAIHGAHEYRIILVNDHSKDHTWAEICRLCREDPCITGIDLARNFGQQAARMAALDYADGDYTVFMDDDGQHPPEGIRALLAKAEEGYDIVYAHFRHSQERGLKRLGSCVNRWMTDLLMQKPREIRQSSFFIVRRYVVEALKQYRSPFPYLFGYLMQITKNIANVDVEHRKRLAGTSGYTFRKLLALWLNGFTGFSVIPLKISTWLGCLSACAGFLFALAVLVQKLLRPEMAVGYASTMIVLLVLGGLILMMLGLLGEYVGRILITVNNIPPYVVKEVCCGDEQHDQQP